MLCKGININNRKLVLKGRGFVFILVVIADNTHANPKVIFNLQLE